MAVILVVVLVSSRNRTQPGDSEVSTALKTTQVTTWPGLDFFPTLSPDGGSVAYSSDHNGRFEIYVKQLTPGAREIPITSDGQQNISPAWSPDGRHIAYYSGTKRDLVGICRWNRPEAHVPRRLQSDLFTRWRVDLLRRKRGRFEFRSVEDSGSGRDWRDIWKAHRNRQHPARPHQPPQYFG